MLERFMYCYSILFENSKLRVSARVSLLYGREFYISLKHENRKEKSTGVDVECDCRLKLTTISRASARVEFANSKD